MANEEKNAYEFITDVFNHCQGFKDVIFFVILDNMSKDSTIKIVKELDREISALKVIWAPENRSVVDAYLRGYREALDAECDWILEIDAGFSHLPSEISRFFTSMVKGYDCVFGSRFCKGGKFCDAKFSRYIISRGGTMLTNLLLGTKLRDMTSGFELFSHRTLKMILDKGLESKGHFFQTEIKVLCRNLKVSEVPITYSNPSKSMTCAVINDAFEHLWRLFILRLKGNL